MTDREEFEKWAASKGLIVERGRGGLEGYVQMGTGFALWGYEARQPEIDTLKAEVERLCNSIPKTPEAIITFIGSHFNSMQPVGDDGTPMGSLDVVTYSLTVHDLLSAFAWAGLDQYEIDAAMKETQ
jgi:hypothetical protein